MKDKFEAFKNLTLGMFVPAWQWRQFEELEIRRAKLSHFCSPEQIKELEQLAFAAGSQTLHSNHDVVCAVLDRAYDIFASGGGFEQAVEQESKLLNSSNKTE